MTTSVPLSDRIKAEFEARASRIKESEQKQAQQAGERERRLAQFGKLCEELQSVWKPRIEDFAKQFGDKITVKPNFTPAAREAKIAFLTDLASMTLTLSVSPDIDVTKLVLDYDLLIIPIVFEYERHARLEIPMDSIDRDALGRWIDDRLVSCVKAYLAIQDNDFYLKRAMVEDPVTKARFLPSDAAAKFEHNGHIYYFQSQDSLKKYKELQQISDKPAAANDADPKTAPATGKNP